MPTATQYNERRAAGLCVECEVPTDGARCSGCNRVARKKASVRRKKRTANGLCFNCGKRKPDPGNVKCSTCIGKAVKLLNALRDSRESQGLCRTCGREEPSPGYRTCNICLEHNRKVYQQHREAVFDHYGRACNCCGEPFQLFLQIDHVHNDGYAHRKEIGPSIYRWLVKNNFPDGFQTLCANCNFAKKYTGRCPCQDTR